MQCRIHRVQNLENAIGGELGIQIGDRADGQFGIESVDQRGPADGGLFSWAAPGSCRRSAATAPTRTPSAAAWARTGSCRVVFKPYPFSGPYTVVATLLGGPRDPAASPWPP